MLVCQPVEHDKMLNTNGLLAETMIVPLDDVKPSTAAAGISPYVLDFSLMATVFAILIFLWME